MKSLSASQWAGMCAELASTARRLAAEGPVLIRRAKEPSGPGYPTSSLSGGGGRSSASDPVGDLVARIVDRKGDAVSDPLAAAVALMVAATWEAVTALRQADAARADAARPPPGPPGNAGVASCVVHARFGLQAPARARGRCRWCGTWAAEHDFADPPESAIRALEDLRIRQAS